MPDSAVAARMLGDTVMAAAAWRRSVPGITVGTALITVGWSHGLFATATPQPRRQPRPAGHD